MSENEKKTQNQRAAARRSCEPPQADGSMRFFLVSELDGFDEVCWFGTGKAFIRRIEELDGVQLTTSEGGHEVA